MKKQLESVRANKKLLKRYYNALKKCKVEYVADVVKDYRRGKHGIPIVIEGYNVAPMEQLKARYKAQISRLIEEIDKAEEIIENVKDPTDRLILSLKYIDGKKIHEIAEDVGYSEDGVKKRLQKFFLTHSEF